MNSTIRQLALIAILTIALAGCGSGSGSGSDPRAANLGNGVSIAITSPTTASYIETPDSAVILAGTAVGDPNIVSVSWTNDRGGQGTASGTENWSTGGIPLELGENVITLTAQGSSGATARTTIVINRESGLAGSATVSWKAPTERTDGSPLTNLAGYRIFYGRMSGIYDYRIDIRNPGVLTYVVENLAPGDWYFAVSAYDSYGIDSDRSAEVHLEIS